MLLVALILFPVAAIFGAIVLFTVLKGSPTPKPLVFIHGSLAGTGFLILLVHSLFIPEPSPTTSVILFSFAVAGGLTALSFDIRKKAIPGWLALLHPIVASLGWLSLLQFVLRH